jgi:antitoxin PrlF
VASAKHKPVYSKVSVKSQTVLPREVRERLKIKPGDQLRYIFDEKGVRIERGASVDDDDPFAAFSEWSSDADDAAYDDL